VAEKSAGQGNAAAQSSLGFLYANGQGVPQDAGQAARWFDRAAKQGYTLAQSNLAAMCRQVRGAKDMGKAYFWLTIAHAKDPSLQSRMLAAEQALSAAERLKVQREVRNWKAGKE
jgi:hypothetical protein